MTGFARPIAATLALALSAVAARPAESAFIVAGPTTMNGTATMDLTLLPSTPFNPTTSPILLSGVSGYGPLTINRETQVGSTILISSISGGAYFGSNPNLGTYVFGNIPPLAGSSFTGSITNVVQNAADPGFATGQASSLQSGDFTLGGASFGFQFLSGPAAGVILFTDPAVPFSFTAHFDGLPPSQGTILQGAGTNVLNIFSGGVLVAQSSNRTITLTTVVPEPGSLALSGLGLALLATRLRLGMRRSPPAL